MKTNDASQTPIRLLPCRLAFGRHCEMEVQYDGDRTNEGVTLTNASLYRCLQLSLNSENTAAFIGCLMSDCPMGTSVGSHQSGLNRPVFRFNTALHLAAYRCKAGVVRELLQSGADPDARNDRDHTPYDIAKMQESIQFHEKKRADCQATLTLFQRAFNNQESGRGPASSNGRVVDSELDSDAGVCLYASER